MALAEFMKEKDKLKDNLKEKLSPEDILDILAVMMLESREREETIGQLKAELSAARLALQVFSSDCGKVGSDKVIELFAEMGDRYCQQILDGLAQKKKNFAKSGADAVHNKSGGSRAKQKQIKDAWATGKYSSRDICAEQECASLEMSFSTARKALRGTPDPT